MFSKRLSPFTTNHLSQEVGSHKGYTLVGIPGQFYHQQIENTFKKVRIILNIKYLITKKYLSMILSSWKMEFS